MKKDIFRLVLLITAYFIFGVAIFFIESETLLPLQDFTISDRLVLNQFNLILFISIGVLLLLVSTMFLFQKKIKTKSSWILWTIKIVSVACITIYWCMQLQWK